MQESNYVKSHAYESYIRLARLCGRDDNGARNSHMHNLMDKEEGGTHVNHLKHDKLLTDVKKYMKEATRYAIKERNLSRVDMGVLESYLPRIDTASASGELLSICNEGIEVLLKYKPS